MAEGARVEIVRDVEDHAVRWGRRRCGPLGALGPVARGCLGRHRRRRAVGCPPSSAGGREDERERDRGENGRANRRACRGLALHGKGADFT